MASALPGNRPALICQPFQDVAHLHRGRWRGVRVLPRRTRERVSRLNACRHIGQSRSDVRATKYSPYPDQAHCLTRWTGSVVHASSSSLDALQPSSETAGRDRPSTLARISASVRACCSRAPHVPSAARRIFSPTFKCFAFRRRNSRCPRRGKLTRTGANAFKWPCPQIRATPSLIKCSFVT